MTCRPGVRLGAVGGHVAWLTVKIKSLASCTEMVHGASQKLAALDTLLDGVSAALSEEKEFLLSEVHRCMYVGWLVVSLVACTNALVPAVLTASLHLSAVKVGATARLVRSRPRALVFVVVASNNAVHSFRPNSSPPLKTARCTSMATRTLFQFLRATSLLGVGATAACRTRPRWWANAPAHRQPLVPCSRH